MHVHHVALGIEVHVPDFFEQLSSPNYLSGVEHEVLQQLKLPGGEVEPFSVGCGLMLEPVQRQGAVGQPLQPGRPAPPNQGPQAGEPFPLGSEATLDVHHTPHTPESVALAVQGPEGRIVYTGDTGPSDELGRWAEGADVLLAECSLPDDRAIAGHLTPASVGRLARVAGPKQLVLTHFYPQVEHVDIRAVVAREYPGPVTLAGDGDRFTVG